MFSYQDPVDKSVSDNQGVRIQFDGGSRVVYRLSGTGTDSATLRVYLEKIERDAATFKEDAIGYNEAMGQFANQVAKIADITGSKEASVKT